MITKEVNYRRIPEIGSMVVEGRVIATKVLIPADEALRRLPVVKVTVEVAPVPEKAKRSRRRAVAPAAGNTTACIRCTPDEAAYLNHIATTIRKLGRN